MSLFEGALVNAIEDAINDVACEELNSIAEDLLSSVIENVADSEDDEDKPIKLKLNTSHKRSKDSTHNEDNPLSPRTRSRGDVRINLWNLDKD